MFTSILLIIVLLCTFGILAALAVIDLRTYLLPNPLVAGLAALGVVFHALSDFQFTSLSDAALGTLFGGGLLYAIRVVANWHYKQDTLGLGDVKLMAAGGLWLGGDFILIAISAGGVLGFLHGLGLWAWQRYGRGESFSLQGLSIPAGPGFILGLLLAGAMKFQSLPAMLGL